MNVAFLFSFGFVVTILEIHLISFKIDQIFIPLFFVLLCTANFITCLTADYALKGIDERNCMILGTTCLSLGYLLLGPYSLLFPKEIWIVVIALAIIGFGQATTYSKIYLVSSVPYMLKCACEVYGYENDDLLTDAISSFCVIGCSSGEILGPLFSGFVSHWLGIETSCNILSLTTFGFTLIFAIVTEIIPTWFNKIIKSSSVPSENTKSGILLTKNISQELS